MPAVIPSPDQMKALVGASRYEIWRQFTALIEQTYDMDCTWSTGGKAWTYEYKYRRGGKTRAVSGKTASFFSSSSAKTNGANLRQRQLPGSAANLRTDADLSRWNMADV